MSNISSTIPVKINSSIIASSSVPEIDLTKGEVAWVSGVAYSKADVVVYAGKKYSAYGAIPARTITPDKDQNYWNFVSPSNKYAAFDDSLSTATVAASQITYVLTPGNFNAIHFFNLSGASSISLLCTDVSTGATVWSVNLDLIDPPIDWFNYFFGAYPVNKPQVNYKAITPFYNGQLTVIINGSNLSAGNIVVGTSIDLAPNFGGAQYGCTITSGDNRTYIKDDFGNAKPVGALISTIINVTAMMSESDAVALQRLSQRFIGVAMPWTIGGTNTPYDNIGDVFGTASITLTLNCNHSMAAITINGYV